MRKQIGSITLPVTPGGSFAQFLRVKIASSVLALAGSTEDEVGVLEQNVITTDTLAAVIPLDDQASRQGVASEAITQYATVYAGASGKIAASGTLVRGIALTSASGDGSIIEYLPQRASTSGAVPRTQLTADTAVVYGIRLASLQATGTGAQLGATAGTPAAAMGLTTGTLGSAAPIVVCEAASGSVKTDKARFQFVLPAEYVSGAAISIRIKCRSSVLATVGSTIVATAYKTDGAAGVGSNLVTTSLITLSATYANRDFAVTPTGLVAGDVLDIEIVGICTDTGGTTGAVIQIGAVAMLLNIKG